MRFRFGNCICIFSELLKQSVKFVSCLGAAVKMMASRINLATRGINCETEYGRHMEDLSRRIFTEPPRTTHSKNLKVVRVMSEEPLEQQPFKALDYYPNQPMFHYLTKMLRFHGLYFDEHVVWRDIQNRLKIARGKATLSADWTRQKSSVTRRCEMKMLPFRYVRAVHFLRPSKEAVSQARKLLKF
ncbi:unnamed protein product [Gongylonema pulchrum]|uniref:Small ribosomal subunit protein mS33 n=1 Tax=Gongylonema pulchrum TaxID=637853 RepID=A0A183EQ75_9BILA|nr:unnamed protein product [Gongylonema pulchrum]